MNISECLGTLTGLNAGAAAGSKRERSKMTLSEYQWEYVGDCEECGTSIYFNLDVGKLKADCPCMTISPESLPEWVRVELSPSIDNLGEAYNEIQRNDVDPDDSMAADHLNESEPISSIDPLFDIVTFEPKEIKVDEKDKVACFRCGGKVTRVGGYSGCETCGQEQPE